MAYLFKLSSRLIVERHLPTIASDAYGIGFVEETLTTPDHYYTAGALQCLFSFRQKLLHSHSVELIGLVILCVFSPLDCCLCSTGLYIKGQDWIGFLLLLLFSFTSLLTPHRTLVNTHKINKCAKFGSILLGVSPEDDENINCHRVSIKFRPSQVVILKFVNGPKTIKTC
jgi:hypothetical protein